MKTLILLFFSVTTFAELNITIPQEFNYKQIKKDYQLIKDWEYRNKLRFTNPEPPPKQQQIKYSWRINALDLATTIYALESCSFCREGNPILGGKPEAYEVIALKLIVLPIIHQNNNEYGMIWYNFIVSVAVVNNLYVINRYD
tara:strand:- start:72 stop:500 length:429 start_codon:yes stop_codon:yes gene_type:complete